MISKQLAERYKKVTGLDVHPAAPLAEADNNDETVYENPATTAQFPGGDAVQIEWIDKNLKDNGNKDATVLVTYIIEKDGMISDIQIVESSNVVELDREARRLVRSMPKHTPALNEKGQPIRSLKKLKVRFRLMLG